MVKGMDGFFLFLERRGVSKNFLFTFPLMQQISSTSEFYTCTKGGSTFVWSGFMSPLMQNGILPLYHGISTISYTVTCILRWRHDGLHFCGIDWKFYDLSSYSRDLKGFVVHWIFRVTSVLHALTLNLK